MSEIHSNNSVVYHPVALPFGRFLYGVFRPYFGFFLSEIPGSARTRAKQVEHARNPARNRPVVARRGKQGGTSFVVFDLENQPADDDWRLVATVLSHDELVERLAREAFLHIEGSIGIEHELAEIARDMQANQWRTLALLNEIAGTSTNPKVRSGLAEQARALNRVAYKTIRGTAVLDVVQALVKVGVHHNSFLFGNPQFATSVQEHDYLFRLVHDRAHDLVNYLDAITAKEAEAIRGRYDAETYESLHPGKYAEKRNELFEAALRLWVQGYIPLSGFVGVTKMDEAGHHWTPDNLALHDRVLKAKVEADKKAAEAAKKKAAEAETPDAEAATPDDADS